MRKLKCKINNDLHSTVHVKFGTKSTIFWSLELVFILCSWAYLSWGISGYPGHSTEPQKPQTPSHRLLSDLPRNDTRHPLKSRCCRSFWKCLWLQSDFLNPRQAWEVKTKLNILYGCEESPGIFWHTNILQAGFFNYTLKEHSSPLSWYASYTAVSVANQWWHEEDWRVRRINEITLTHGMTMT